MNRPFPPLRMLPYRKPTEGRDYWLLDDALPNAMEVRERCLAKQDWALGFPHTQERWPGRRAIPALESSELAAIEDKVRQATGTRRLWVQGTPEGKTLNHNWCRWSANARPARAHIPTPAHWPAMPACCTYSAIAYCGEVLANERMAAVFFWMGV